MRVKKNGQCRYNVTIWRVRIIFIRTSSALLEACYLFTRRERFMMNSYFQKKYNVLGSSLKITFCKQIIIVHTDFRIMKFHSNPPSWRQRGSRTDGQRDMTKLIWALSDRVKTTRNFGLNPQTASSRRIVCGCDERYYCKMSAKRASELSLCSIVTVVTYYSVFFKEFLTYVKLPHKIPEAYLR